MIGCSTCNVRDDKGPPLPAPRPVRPVHEENVAGACSKWETRDHKGRRCRAHQSPHRRRERLRSQVPPTTAPNPGHVHSAFARTRLSTTLPHAARCST